MTTVFKFVHPFDLAAAVPLRDRLLVLPLAAPSRTQSGLHIAENSHQREKPQEGLVLSVGPGRVHPATGVRLPMDVSVGDVVRFGKYSGQEITLGPLTVLNMQETEVVDRRPHGSVEIIVHERPKDWHVAGVFCELCAQPNEDAARERLAVARETLIGGAAGLAAEAETV